MQLVALTNLQADLAQYMDPDGATFGEEIAAFVALVQAEFARCPHITHLLLWDSGEGSDPELNLPLDLYDREVLIPEVTYNSTGDSYYGAARYTRNTYPVGQFVLSLWYGGCPLQSAGGFHILPVA